MPNLIELELIEFKRKYIHDKFVKFLLVEGADGLIPPNWINILSEYG
jgi:hypothetical protein